jgi:hypothetical protein
VVRTETAQYGVDGIQQISPHHTDFVNYQQIKAADDIDFFPVEPHLLCFHPVETDYRAERQLKKGMNRYAAGIDGGNARRRYNDHTF